MAYYYFKVGSQIYPNKPVYLYNSNLVGNGSEAFAELLKSFHSLDTLHGNSAITFQQYNTIAVAAGSWAVPYAPSLKSHGDLDTSNNAFCVGQEFESFCHKSDTILSGLSTLNTNLFFTFGVIPGANGTGANNITAEFYAQYDLILVLQDGYISAKY